MKSLVFNVRSVAGGQYVSDGLNGGERAQAWAAVRSRSVSHLP